MKNNMCEIKFVEEAPLNDFDVKLLQVQCGCMVSLVAVDGEEK